MDVLARDVFAIGLTLFLGTIALGLVAGLIFS